MKTVEVLLATYNSERWLPDLFKSLDMQTCQNFRLIVSDDGSTDKTMAILAHYQAKLGDRMEIHQDHPKQAEAIANFARLVQRSVADFVFFCDHDDIWMPDKISVLLAEAQRLETVVGTHTPIFVFSDAEIIDANGNVTQSSFWQFKKYNPALACSLSHLIMCPPMLGCVSVVNRACINLSRPVPSEAIGHDWWMALIACAIGRIHWVGNKTIKYRIHGQNTSRPRRISAGHLLLTKGKVEIVRQGMSRRYLQAEALLRTYFDVLPDQQKCLLQKFVGMQNTSWPARRIQCLRYRYLYPDCYRTSALLMFM